MFKGKCIPMVNETFPDGAISGKALDHKIHLTVHGVVQGWTTARGGKPVAVVNQRSTYNHDVDSVVGFLGFGEPALTHDAKSWMAAASHVDYTFNWFYVDSKDIGYYVSGLDPVRPSDVDPNLPTWGTGESEWLGFLPASQHVHEINPPQGFFVSWNNKPAPRFSASDGEYGYGPVYRVQMLTTQIKHQFALHHGKITRADVVQAMETAASQDLDGLTILPALLHAVAGRHEPAGVNQMLAALRAWYASGAHRILASPSATQYEQADAVAIMDQLTPAVIKAIFDPLFAAGGTNPGGYNVFPMGFVNEPLQRRQSSRQRLRRRLGGLHGQGPGPVHRHQRRAAVQPRGDHKTLQQQRRAELLRHGARRRPGVRLPGPGQGERRVEERVHLDPGREHGRHRADHAGLRRHRLPVAGDRRPAQHPLAEPADVPAGGLVPGAPPG